MSVARPGVHSALSGPARTWKVIASDLEHQIRERTLNPGDRLPTEQSLTRKYMVKRHTVRRALAHLQAKGLVESTQGRGSFVRRPALQFRIQRRTRFSENVRHLAASHRHETLTLDVRPAEAHVAQALNLAAGAPVVYIERLGIVNDTPVGIGRHHFSFERLPFFPAMYVRHGSITETLKSSGILDYVRVRTRVHARLPSPQECELLKCPRHVPLLITQAINNDGLGVPLEYGDARFASDRVEFLIEDEQGGLSDLARIGGEGTS
jgi:GntR family transcriptional regulator, phosphonate transport system regulatory protein